MYWGYGEVYKIYEIFFKAKSFTQLLEKKKKERKRLMCFVKKG